MFSRVCKGCRAPLTLACNLSLKGGHLAKRTLNLFTGLNSCNGLLTSPRIYPNCLWMLPWGISIYKSQCPYFRSPFGLHSFGPIKIGLSFYTWKYWFYVLLLWEIGMLIGFLIFSVDIKTQTKNPRKRNSPLNTCVGGIRLEGCMLYLTCKLTWYLLLVA